MGGPAPAGNIGKLPLHAAQTLKSRAGQLDRQLRRARRGAACRLSLLAGEGHVAGCPIVESHARFLHDHTGMARIAFRHGRAFRTQSLRPPARKPQHRRDTLIMAFETRTASIPAIAWQADATCAVEQLNARQCHSHAIMLPRLLP